MRSHTFDLRLMVDRLTDDDVEKLYVADGTPWSRNGTYGISMTRWGKDKEAAVASAIRECKRAGYKARPWTRKDEEIMNKPEKA